MNNKTLIKVFQSTIIFIALCTLNISLSAIERERTRNEVLEEIDKTISSIANVKTVKTKDENNKTVSHYAWVAQYDKPNYDNGKINKKSINMLVNNWLPQVIVYTNPPVTSAILKEVFEKLEKINGVVITTGSIIDNTPKDGRQIGILQTADKQTAHIYFVPNAEKTKTLAGQTQSVTPRK
ncbi:MAG TPA: hypothetical protein VHO47_04630 [Candidatus Babeliales bacterium]|nr:hypothetical protein [Candidatus Babeliales bacterium]